MSAFTFASRLPATIREIFTGKIDASDTLGARTRREDVPARKLQLWHLAARAQIRLRTACRGTTMDNP